jgi:hypothetical protein
MIPRHILRLTSVFTFLAGQLSAQAPHESFDSHIIWKQAIEGVTASVLDQATTDSSGDLWFVSDPFNGQPRLVHVDSTGRLVSNDKLPDAIRPSFPETSSFALAAATNGKLAILASHSHAVERAIYADGADFALIDGTKVGPPARVAGSGPEYKGLLALSDDHFLVMGDQAPMVLIRIGAAGKIDWLRRFPSSWDLPSGASLKDGAACVLSSGYGVPWMHLMKLDDAGHVRSQIKFQGWNGVISADLSDSCVALYSTGSPKQNRIRLHLASFDSSLRQNWSTAMPIDSPWGGSFYLASLKDGWVVVTELYPWSGTFLIAKYDLSGSVVWSLPGVAIPPPTVVVGAADSFYLVYERPEDLHSSIVIRAR